ncbi:hypothetical protein AGMMS49965_07750 [Bacteroidia bacterium]|nr:hypothetical protein AGMMS49965_07750 [Bacteroidia bacterium]
MKANAKGLVIALLAPFVLSECNDNNEEAVMLQTETPQVFENTVVKTAAVQQSVDFFLSAESVDAEWKVYSSATGANTAAGMTAECSNGAVLVLINTIDVRPSTYFVSATEPGKTESARIKLTVLEQAQTATPTTSIAAVAKSGEEQANVSFTLDNAADYSSVARWIVHSFGKGEGLISTVRASLNGDVLTLMHNSDVPDGPYYIAVVDEGKSESERLTLTVDKYVPGQTPAPIPENNTVVKTTPTQESAAFTMRNAYIDPQWKVYTSATGGLSIVDVSYFGNTLTLAYSPDIPEGAYFVTVTDGGYESARIKLTVSPYIALPTATPTTDLPSIVKTAVTQPSVTFTLTNSILYPSNTAWKVYAMSSGNTPALNIIATLEGTVLTLRHPTNIPAGNYWVSATENKMTESGRLALQITDFEVAKTATPTVATSGVIKTGGIEPRVTFTLTNSPAYPSSPTTRWKVYFAETGNAEENRVIATSMGSILTLEHATDVPEQIYYVSATEPDKEESDRLALTVSRERTLMPVIDTDVVVKTTPTQSSVDFILLNDDPAEYPDSITTWELYGEENSTLPLVNVSVIFNRTAGSQTLLTLENTTTNNITARNYWLAATISGKVESERVRLTVIEYDPGVTPTPMATTTTLTKTSAPQSSISFPLDNASAYSVGTYTWKVYPSQESIMEVSYISASLFLGSLRLTHVGSGMEIATGSFWVSVTDDGLDKPESGRLKLTINPYVQSVTPTPTADVASVAKTTASQSSVDFVVSNGHLFGGGGTTAWNVYSTATETGVPPVTLSFNATNQTLTLFHSSNIPLGNYWITATDVGKKESGRLRLTITAYVQGVTPTPTADVVEVAKTSLTPQASAAFTLTNAINYSGATIWKVYTSAAGPGLDGDVTAYISNTFLLLQSNAGDVAPNDYYVSATNAPADTESGRLRLTVTAYVPSVTLPGVTTAPNFSVLCNKPDLTVPSVSIPLLNAATYSSSTVWKVYSEATASTESELYPDLTATLVGTSLKLTSSTGDVTARNYWITATNPPEAESERRLLGVIAPPWTQTPTAQSTSFARPPHATPSISLNLTNNPPYTSGCVWRIYTTALGGTPITNMTRTLNVATQELRLTSATGDLAAGDYYLSAQEPNQTESTRLHIRVLQVVVPLTGLVTISGTTQIRDVLSANISLLDGIGAVRYQWLRNGVNIIGANSQTYTLVTDDVGSRITVVVTRAGYTGSVTGGPSAVVVLPTLTGAVAITGDPEVSQTLTANIISLNNGGSGTISYQWRRQGNNIGGRTASTYTLVAADTNYTITVAVRCTGYVGEVIGGPTAVVVPTPALTGTVTIDGDPEVREILTANTSLLNGSGSRALSYQWQRNNVNITGATGQIYTLADADAGATITVEVKRAGYTGSVISVPTAAITFPALKGTVTIDGAAEVGAILTANTDFLNGSGTLSYQWKWNTGTIIDGATGATYIPVVADTAQQLSVEVSRVGYSGSVTSSPTGNIVLPDPNYEIASPTSQDLTIKFGLRKSESTPLTNTTISNTFAHLHQLISNPKEGDDFTRIIQLGDYIDLLSLTIAGVKINDAMISGHDRILRLRVVGINSFKRDSTGAVGTVNPNNLNAPDHLVFHFQNIPVENTMYNDSTGYGEIGHLRGGYLGSEMRAFIMNAFLPGLKIATGLNDAMLWGPTRKLPNGGKPSISTVRYPWTATGTDDVKDVLWLPTEWEMYGGEFFYAAPMVAVRYSSSQEFERDPGQSRLEYYYGSNARRIKYDRSNTAKTYFLASPDFSATWDATVCGVQPTGIPARCRVFYKYHCVPAFCVK